MLFQSARNVRAARRLPLIGVRRCDRQRPSLDRRQPCGSNIHFGITPVLNPNVTPTNNAVNQDTAESAVAIQRPDVVMRATENAYQYWKGANKNHSGQDFTALRAASAQRKRDRDRRYPGYRSCPVRPRLRHAELRSRRRDETSTQYDAHYYEKLTHLIHSTSG